MTPTYLVCTNLYRDSLKRNAHTEFIAGILTNNIPKETKLILNGDDLIVADLAPENNRAYFGIDRIKTDTDKCENIVQDMCTCPKCDSKLEYEFVRYNHVGRAHCPNCDFASPKINYEVTNIDYEDVRKMAHEHQPKLIICGASNYSKIIDFSFAGTPISHAANSGFRYIPSVIVSSCCFLSAERR